MGALSWGSWLFASLIVFAAGFIQTLTGFGFGLVAVPLLLYVLPSHEALMMSMILSLFSFSLQAVRMVHQARWGVIGKLIVSSVPGLVLGIYWGEWLNPAYIKGVVGFVLILYVFWQWSRLKREEFRVKQLEGASREEGSFKEADFTESQHMLKRIKSSSLSKLYFYLAGLLSGILNGMAAIPGPPVIAVLINRYPKEIFQATIVNFFIVQYTMTLTGKILFQKSPLTQTTIILMLLMILPVILGHQLGRPLLKRINNENFKKLVFALLFVIGITSLWEPIHVFFRIRAF